MSSKSQTLQKSTVQEQSAVQSKRKQTLKFSLAVVAFASLLALSIANDYLFFEWLSVSIAIILCLFAIHIIGEQQIKKQ